MPKKWVVRCAALAIFSCLAPGLSAQDKKQLGKPCLLHVIQTGEWHLLSVAFSPDGKTVAAGNLDGVIRFWDVATAKPVGKILAHATPAEEMSRALFSIAYSPDGKMLASVGTGGGEGRLRVWNVAQGQEIWRRENLLYGNNVAFSPDGKSLALSCFKALYLLDATKGKEKWKGAIDPGFFSFVSFSRNGKLLASGGHAFNHLRIWDVDKGKEIHKIELNKKTYFGGVHALAFTGDDRIAVGAFHTSIAIWDLKSLDPRRLLRRTYPKLSRVMCLVTSSDGRFLAYAGAKGDFGVFCLETGELKLTGVGADAGDQVAISPDNRFLATTDWTFQPRQATLKIWDLSRLQKQDLPRKRP